MSGSVGYDWVVEEDPLGKSWILMSRGRYCGSIVKADENQPGRGWKYHVWGPPNARNKGDFLGGYNNLSEAKAFLLKQAKSKIVKTHLRV